MKASFAGFRSSAPGARILGGALLALALVPLTLSGCARGMELAADREPTVVQASAQIDRESRAATREQAERRAEALYRSPRMLRLFREYQADGAAAIERFAREVEGHAPLVEPLADDPRGEVLVTFLWRGGPDTHYVGIFGGPVIPGLENPLRRFEDTDLWYLTVRAPRDLRATYSFLTGEPPDAGMTTAEFMARYDLTASERDPWNPRRRLFGSVIELPDAPPQPWSQRIEGTPEGRVVETTLHSDTLGEDRTIGVYLPHEFDPTRGPYPYVIVFDGELYGLMPDPEIPTPTILDNLIAQGRLPPMVAVLVASQGTRNRDLLMSAPFCGFVANELVPWLRREYRAAEAPDQATLAGASLGGLFSSYCALQRPDVFGEVLSQSGSFGASPGAFETTAPYQVEAGALMREVRDAPWRPVRFWMEVGIFETTYIIAGDHQLSENRAMRDLLIAKGYDVSYREYSGGHDFVTWRGSLADGLIHLAGARAPATQAATRSEGR